MSDELDPIDRLLVAPYDEARTSATWKRIAERRRAIRARRPRTWIVAGVGAFALAAAIAIAAWPSATRPEPGALASHDLAISVTPGTIWTASGHDVVLDDDSKVALGSGARLEILANEGTRFATLLQAGSAHFDVHPHGPRRWEIETALASVEVVGTAFTVGLHDHQLEVGVDRGVVLVHGEQVPGRVVRLTAGEHIVVGQPPVVSPAAIVPPAPAPPIEAPVAPAPRAHVPPTAIRAHEPAAAAVAQPSLADVVADADRLSGAGDPAGAARLLERVRGRVDDPASGLVAFTLGRLYLDALAKPELAAAAFDEVIAGGTPRSLLEDAYARRVEALVRAHRGDQATTALAAYAHAYPRGRRLAALRALVDAP